MSFLNILKRQISLYLSKEDQKSLLLWLRDRVLAEDDEYQSQKFEDFTP